MSKFIWKLVTLMLGLLSVVSCQHGVIDPDTTTGVDLAADAYTMDDGVLVFKNSESLRQQIEQFRSYSDKELIDWNAQVAITSVYEQQIKLSNTTASGRSAAPTGSELSQYVHDKYLASLLN